MQMVEAVCKPFSRGQCTSTRLRSTHLTKMCAHTTLCHPPRSDLTPAYVKLLRDPEAEVRIAAAGKVAAFCKMLTAPLIVSQVGGSCVEQPVGSGSLLFRHSEIMSCRVEISGDR